MHRIGIGTVVVFVVLALNELCLGSGMGLNKFTLRLAEEYSRLS